MNKSHDIQSLLTNHQSLIYGALARCHIDPRSNDYEDFRQIAQIAFYDGYVNYPEKPITTLNLPSFRLYVFQKMVWEIKSYLKRITRQKQYHLMGPEGDDTPEKESEESCDGGLAWIDTLDILQRLYPILSKDEQRFLKAHFYEEKTISQIAKEEHVSRKTVYAWRNRVALKYLALMEED